MKRKARTLRGTCMLYLAVALLSCERNTTCGVGTLERNGSCVPAQPVAGGPCDTAGGAVLVGGICYPDPQVLCGPDTTWDPTAQNCKSTGGGTQATSCSSRCSAPGSQTVCVSGTVEDFVTQTKIQPTAMSHLSVKIYDPIAFASNPGTVPLASADIEADGCYVADGVQRPSSGLIAIGVDDVDNATADDYVNTGGGSVLEPSKNVLGLVAYALPRAQVAAWQAQLGASGPVGCSDLGSCGMWIGSYTLADGTPVAGVTPTRPGDPPSPTAIFCFRGDRMTLTTADTTDATGLCVLSPDSIEGHAGQCASTGCTCGGMPCSPSFTPAIGGTSPNVVFFQPLRAM